MSPDLLARATAAAAFLRGTARMVGKPGAVQGIHVAGPTRGRSVVVLDLDVAAVLDELIAALDSAPVASVSSDLADAFGMRDLPNVKVRSDVPVTTSQPTTRRFRGIMDEEG